MDEDVKGRLRAAMTSRDVEDLLDLGCKLTDVDRLPDAESCFRTASELGSPEGAFNLGNSLAAQERWVEAVTASELAIERGKTQAWLNFGLVLHELGDLAGEIRAYEQAEVAGDDAGPLGMAFALREQGDREAAMAAARRSAELGNVVAAAVVACWRWCLTLDPQLEDDLRTGANHFPSARADLGHLLASTGRVDEARQVFELGMSRREVESMVSLGNLCTDVLDDETAAEAAYRAAIELGDAHAHNNLAVLLLEAHGDVESAATHFRLAIAGGDTLAIANLRDLEDD